MSYPAAQTFWVEPTDTIEHYLRRYASGSVCPAESHGYHDAQTFVGDRPTSYVESHGRRSIGMVDPTPYDDARWPTHCACGYLFTPEDAWQDFQELVYRHAEGVEYVLTHRGGPRPLLPPGGSWNAWWMPFSRGPDGRSLMVRCPNGQDWNVDSRASNCTMPKDDEHRCWVRHGDPTLGQVTVDKNGLTCAAGAGSIQAGDYHGFLQNGVLTPG